MESIYNHLKAKIKTAIIAVKKAVAEKAKANVRKLWQVVHEFGGKSSTVGGINHIIEQFDNKTEAANAINNLFSSVFNVTDCFEEQDYIGVNAYLKLNWNPVVDPEWMFSFLEGLNVHKATSDFVSPRLYKAAAAILCNPLTHLVNESMLTCTVPDAWKLAHVVPVPKTNRPTLDQLRPISLLPVPEKILEKAVMFNCKKSIIRLIDQNQFAYRPFGSTVCATTLMYDTCVNFTDQKNVSNVLVFSFDLSKAFDTVPHDLLLYKINELCMSDLLSYGFLTWCTSYLSNRRQNVCVGSILSDSILCTSGVPQGSILGPQ